MWKNGIVDQSYYINTGYNEEHRLKFHRKIVNALKSVYLTVQKRKENKK
jgi:hypothetical protein